MSLLSGNRLNKQIFVGGDHKAYNGTYAGKQAVRESMFLVKDYGNNVLDGLPDEDLALLKPFMERGTVAAGTSLYQPDDKIKYVYFPENAVISQYCILEDGRTLEIAMIGREGLTGHTAIFGAHTNSFWTQVSVEGKVSKISVDAVKQVFDKSETLQKLLLDYSNKYTTQISNRVICNNYHSIEERFCSWILMLSDRHASTKLSLTHSQIANYLGVHRPSFTHIAKKLREEKLIDYSRGHLKITDRDGMMDFACDCYRQNNVLN